MSDFIQAFGRTVRQLREARNWSQELLAEKADLNRSYLGEIERGDVVPSLLTAAKLSNAFALPVSALLAASEGLQQ